MMSGWLLPTSDLWDSSTTGKKNKNTLIIINFDLFYYQARPCNVDLVVPHFYIVKLAFTWVYMYIFSFFVLKHILWVLIRLVAVLSVPSS